MYNYHYGAVTQNKLPSTVFRGHVHRKGSQGNHSWCCLVNLTWFEPFCLFVILIWTYILVCMFQASYPGLKTYVKGFFKMCFSIITVFLRRGRNSSGLTFFAVCFQGEHMESEMLLLLPLKCHPFSWSMFCTIISHDTSDHGPEIKSKIFHFCRNPWLEKISFSWDGDVLTIRSQKPSPWSWGTWSIHPERAEG